MKRQQKSQSGQVLIKGAFGAGSAAGLLLLQAATVFSHALDKRLYRAIQTALATFISMVGGFVGIQQVEKSMPQLAAPTALAAVSSSPNHAKTVGSLAARGKLHKYVYVFEGTAVLEGNPARMAGVSVTINSGQGSQAKSTLTDGEGRYSVAFDVYAVRNEPIHWGIVSHTTNRHARVRLSGQRIAMREEEITLEKPLVLAQLDRHMPNIVIHEDDDLDPL